MRKILAIALLSVAAGAGAQSYEDRAAAERAQAAVQAVDQAKMDEARRAQAPQPQRMHIEPFTPIEFGVTAALIAAIFWGASRLLRRKKR